MSVDRAPTKQERTHSRTDGQNRRAGKQMHLEEQGEEEEEGQRGRGGGGGGSACWGERETRGKSSWSRGRTLVGLA